MRANGRAGLLDRTGDGGIGGVDVGESVNSRFGCFGGQSHLSRIGLEKMVCGGGEIKSAGWRDQIQEGSEGQGS